jgi:anti-sigma factor RsiW
MKHVNNIKLLDYVAGKLPVSEAEQVRRHIVECSDCASRYREALATWGALGEWRVDPSAHLIAERIETLTIENVPERQQQPPKAMIPLRSSFVAALRIAAAVIIAATCGYVLGKYSAPRSAPEPPAAGGGPRYLAALDFQWSSGLTWTVLEQDAASGANRQ